MHMERSDIPPKRDLHTLIVFGCELIVECAFAGNPCNPLIQTIRDSDNGCVHVFGICIYPLMERSDIPPTSPLYPPHLILRSGRLSTPSS